MILKRIFAFVGMFIFVIFLILMLSEMFMHYTNHTYSWEPYSDVMEYWHTGIPFFLKISIYLIVSLITFLSVYFLENNYKPQK